VHRLTFEMKNGTKQQIELAARLPRNFRMRPFTLDGEAVLMEFPWASYQTS